MDTSTCSDVLRLLGASLGAFFVGSGTAVAGWRKHVGKIIVAFGLCLIVLSGLFPPWVETWVDLDSARAVSLGRIVYSFVLVPPDPISAYQRYRIDGRLLILEWVFIAILAAGTYWLLGRKDQRRSAD